MTEDSPLADEGLFTNRNLNQLAAVQLLQARRQWTAKKRKSSDLFGISGQVFFVRPYLPK